MNRTVNVIGASGLVGRRLVEQLLSEPAVGTIRIFTRRSTGFEHPRIEEHVIDFENVESWKNLVRGDVLYSTLGTTLRQAGSKEAQYKVDFTYQYQFARAAAANGVRAYVLVSSAGADPESMIFYSRMKGELDAAVERMPFEHCTILRPSILEGERERTRPAERIAGHIMKFVTRYIFKKYRPISGDVVARAMINASLHTWVSGIQVFTLGAIFELARQ